MSEWTAQKPGEEPSEPWKAVRLELERLEKEQGFAAMYCGIGEWIGRHQPMFNILAERNKTKRSPIHAVNAILEAINDCANRIDAEAQRYAAEKAKSEETHE